jgi:hypothetical protein
VDNLIFSQSAIFRLHQLGSQFYHHSGVRHKLSTPQGILDLLRSTATSTEKEVRICYDAFVLELNKRQIDTLAARGVTLRHPQITRTVNLRQVG